MFIFMGGVNGAGKSTVLEGVKEQRPQWQYIRASQAFMEWLGFPGDYERLRVLEAKERDEKLALFMKELLEKKSGPSPLLLDCHYLNLKDGLVDRVVGPWISQFDALVLISAPHATILERLSHDRHLRDRRLFPEGLSETEQENMLEAYAQKTEEVFLELSSDLSLPSLKIENVEKETSVRELINFVEYLLSKNASL